MQKAERVNSLIGLAVFRKIVDLSTSLVYPVGSAEGSPSLTGRGEDGEGRGEARRRIRQFVRERKMSSFFYSPRGRGAGGVPFRKRKSRFTFDEVQLLLNEVRNNRHIVIGKFNRGVSADVKKRTWAEITARINEISECPREIIEIIKKWSDLKCDTKRKVAAMRAGLGGASSALRISRDLSPVENMVHEILQLPPRDDGTSGYPGGWAGLGGGRVEENGDDDDDDDDVLLGMPSANGRLDLPPMLPMPHLPPHPLGIPVSMAMPMPLPPHPLAHKGELAMPPSVYGLSARDPAFSLPVSGDGPLSSYEMQYEIPHAEDQGLDVEDSDGERREGPRPPPFLAPPSPAEEEHHLTGLRRAAAVSSARSSSSSSSTAVPAPSSSSAAAPPAPSPRGVEATPPPPPPAPASSSARDKMLQNATASVREQHATNALLETVSRSLVLLSESVQQLVETQQEFVRDSLRLQQETVHILRDFSTGALALMRDKLNGRPPP
ncbi:myb-related transcription factor, partner of profilin isoform X1 [Anguilla anguilla]|uniref:myb-related transcription factor, partner of profilin isoform X1 n=2 Tax=Anguilla anguilla TaxID=7936 RepID=UPI0015B16E73|nr:myb-related transcription factor, partner of profilin isoform X1 [Anguilla anguilla]